MAIDPDTKLIPAWLVGTRDVDAAYAFMADLRSRLANQRVQITTDGHAPYIEAIGAEFGADVDYSMLVKSYGSPEREYEEVPQARKYSDRKSTRLNSSH